MNPMIYPTRGGTRGNSSACRIGTLAAALTLAVGFASEAEATIVVGTNSVVFGFDSEYSGASSPEGGIPWLVATLEDNIVPGSVRFTLEAPNAAVSPFSGLTDSEKVAQVMFNLKSGLDPSLLGVVSGSIQNLAGTFTSPTVTFAPPAISGAGYSPFEMLVQFSNPPAQAFTAGDKVQFLVSYSGGNLLASDFLATAPGPNDPADIFAAAHILSIDIKPGDEQGSGWVHPVNVIPEPGSSFAVILLLSSGLVLRSRRTRSA
jgi:hypothetical protein